MSVRIHVVGAYGATEAQFRAALDRIGGDGGGSQRFRIGSNGDWMWANASVWTVAGSEIDAALDSLPVPALRVTSSDAVLWMLTLTRPGKEPFRGVHHFTLVGSQPPDPQPRQTDYDEDFPEDELEEVAGINRFIPELQFLWDHEEEARLQQEFAEEAADTVEGLDDYVDYGVCLPETTIHQMKRDPQRAHHTAFMAHGAQIVDALEEFGFDVDRDAMAQLLTVGPLTSIEQDADVGNMPRFLQLLGIDGVFREESEAQQEPQTEQPSEEEFQVKAFDASKYPPGQLLERVQQLQSQCELAEISGGVVKCPHAVLPHLLAHLCAEDPVVSVCLELPGGTIQPSHRWEELPDLEVRRSGGSWQFCFQTPPNCWAGVEEREELESHEIAEPLLALPEGARIEFTFVVDGLAEQCHRYAGTYRDRQLEIDRVFPSVGKEVLGNALGLIDQIFDTKPIELASEEEERAVRADYERAHNEVPRIRNGKILPAYGSRAGVVQTILFERLADRGPWDMAGARRLVESDWEWFEQIVNANDDRQDNPDLAESSDQDAELPNHLKQISEAIERYQESQVVPHSEEVLYVGRTGNFYRASMSDLKHIPQDRLEEHDATLAELGFRPICDSVGDADQRQEITRCYAGNPNAISLFSHRNEDNQIGWAEVAHGAVMVDFSEGTIEFHTHFDDGTSLVTTSVDAAVSRPEAGIYVRCYEDLPTNKLWAKHLDGISRFQQHRKTYPIDHTELAACVPLLAVTDEMLSRFVGED